MSAEVVIDIGQEDARVLDLQRFLVRYGYLNKEKPPGNKLDDETAAAMVRFQQFYGLKTEGGRVTDDDLKAIEIPRCALWDWRDSGPLEGCRWPQDVRTLVYEFGTETGDLPPGEAFDAVLEAIELWNLVLKELGIALKLDKRLASDPTVHIRFEWRNNDPRLSGKPVAHSDFPPGCGVFSKTLPRPVHFDDGERWTLGVVPGRFHIKSIAMHEIGHIIGLPHLPRLGHLMSPELMDGAIQTNFSQEDEDAIIKLYK